MTGLSREVLLDFLNVSLAYGDICGGVAPVVIDHRDFGNGTRYKDKEGIQEIENEVVIDMDLAVLQELGADGFEVVQIPTELVEVFGFNVADMLGFYHHPKGGLACVHGVYFLGHGVELRVVLNVPKNQLLLDWCVVCHTCIFYLKRKKG